MSAQREARERGWRCEEPGLWMHGGTEETVAQEKDRRWWIVDFDSPVGPFATMLSAMDAAEGISGPRGAEGSE